MLPGLKKAVISCRAQSAKSIILLSKLISKTLSRPFNSIGALERAKHSVESQYSVVGVLEDLNTTLSVLEKYVPRFFQGVREIYDSKFEASNFEFPQN